MKYQADDETFSAIQGSQVATRLIGGWFVNADKLPKKATIKLSESSDGTQVSARIEETLGFGLLDPKFKRKYEDHFESWLTDLKNTLT